MSTLALRAAVLIAVAGVSACATSAPPVAVRTAGVVAPQGEGVPVPVYKLGSGDKLRLIVFGEPSLSGEFVVDDAGNVDLPLIGTVQARGAPVSRFQNNVVTRLKQGYLNDPKVSIEVLNYRPFFITGEVANSGQFPYKAGLTVREAVAIAGGYTYRANTSKVFIRRAGRDAEQTVALERRVLINPGDQIRIPERFF